MLCTNRASQLLIFNILTNIFFGSSAGGLNCSLGKSKTAVCDVSNDCLVAGIAYTVWLALFALFSIGNTCSVAFNAACRTWSL